MELREAQAARLCRLAQSATAFVLLVRALSGAVVPDQSISQYAHTAWSRDNGRLIASIRALAQTSDGRLWIGTEFGLEQFDGVRFRPWKPPTSQQLSSDYIMGLASAGDGSLWIGTREGISQWNGVKVRNYQTSKGSAGGKDR